MRHERDKYKPSDFDEHFPSGASQVTSDEAPLSVLHGSGTCNISAMKGGVVRRYSGATVIIVRNRKLGIRFENQGSASIRKHVRGQRLDDGVWVHENFEDDPADIDILLVSQRSGYVDIEFL